MRYAGSGFAWRAGDGGGYGLDILSIMGVGVAGGKGGGEKGGNLAPYITPLRRAGSRIKMRFSQRVLLLAPGRLLDSFEAAEVSCLTAMAMHASSTVSPLLAFG